MKVRDLMCPEVITVKEGMDIHSLARLLTEARITGCPVVNEQEELVGVVSLFDLASHQAAVGDAEAASYWQSNPRLPGGYSVQDLSRSQTTVAQVMTPACYSVDWETEVADLCDFFLKGEIHRVLVTRGGKLAGIVTGTDLLRLLRQMLLPVAREDSAMESPSQVERLRDSRQHLQKVFEELLTSVPEDVRLALLALADLHKADSAITNYMVNEFLSAGSAPL